MFDMIKPTLVCINTEMKMPHFVVGCYVCAVSSILRIISWYLKYNSWLLVIVRENTMTYVKLVAIFSKAGRKNMTKLLPHASAGI